MKEYYLGLDIGTDSVGYAVTNETYDLLKFKGEPVWGVTTFEAASTSAERRAARTARRRYDRRQQRVALISELFAEEICKIDPNFFIRRKESALFAEDTTAGVKIFDGGITDKEYHNKYPTIHHLICDLMTSDAPHDIRLVYLATSWLVANRGHFLFDVSVDDVGKLMDFTEPYEEFRNYLAEISAPMPWDDAVEPATILSIMQMKTGVTRKQDAFKARVYRGKAPGRKKEEDIPFNRNEVVKLLCGGTSKPKDLFLKEEYKDLASLSLGMNDEQFMSAAAELGEDGELLRRLRAMYDCALLITSVGGGKTVSAAKVAVYNQHKEDLKYLKWFLRKYKPKAFSPMFRAPAADNYVAYSYHVKSCKNPSLVSKKARKQEFSEYLKKTVKGITVEEADREKYEDMLNRLELQTFLPKQKDTDNRVIPMQLYHYELAEILRRASGYLPMLTRKDETGLTVAEKILSVFDFRIPYFVGPLNAASSHAWLEREAGKIYPWNFEQLVDLDASEKKFINRMTNKCTYWPGKDVLPVNSLLYERFTVLNAINNLKLNGQPIPVETKQAVFRDLFEANKPGKRPVPVTLKAIRNYLLCHGAMKAEDELSGLDITYKGILKTHHSFRRMLEAGVLTKDEVEDIVNHAAYSEDRLRMEKWLRQHYPKVCDADRKYILSLKLKEFGRLSREFLTELVGADEATGEARTIMEALWETNENLMQLLSERYTYREQLDEKAVEYYASEHKTLSERLGDMYISNAVKRPIIRALDVTGDVVKAMGCPPKKIFVEMARGASKEQKGKRTQSRKQQLLELYKHIKTEDARILMKELEAMGDMADNQLQSDKLFLYYTQMGRCMYTPGRRIDISELPGSAYNIDHIYPRSYVKDDSVINNKVLVCSEVNGDKNDVYPIAENIRADMQEYWTYLKKNNLISEEKYKRLTRSSGFSDEEKYGFINRQLVETRQSTKAVAQLLKEKYPDAEIVYVKAGLVSEFRQEFGMLKCRAVNDLHHAKDAYLNIVVGNVYTERFKKKWFNIHDNYSMNTKPLYSHKVVCGGKTIWRGEKDIAKVKKFMGKNAVHLTRYAFCRKGALFKESPKKADKGLIPRKKDLPAEKYGGYQKPTATFFSLVQCCLKGKHDLIIVPIGLPDGECFIKSKEYALRCAEQTAKEIMGDKVRDVSLPLGNRPLKVNTVLSLDGLNVVISGKSNGGKVITIAPLMPLILSAEQEHYVKRLERLVEKNASNKLIQADYQHDHISQEENRALYTVLLEKLCRPPFSKLPGSPIEKLQKGADLFDSLTIKEQADVIMSTLRLVACNSGGADFSKVGATKQAGAKTLSTVVSNWKNKYTDVRIVDMSASGLYVSRSENLLDLL